MDRALHTVAILAVACTFNLSSAAAQRQPTFGGAICYTLEDILEVIGEASKPDQSGFKRYWEAKKATGKCFFNLTDNGQNPVFNIEDTNVAEREYQMQGKTVRAIIVRGRIGTQSSGRTGYSFLQISN